MSPSETPHSSSIPLDSPKISPLRSIAAVFALSLGCFTFVSTELMPVGVLPEMAKGLGVSLGAVGYLVTLFAFVVALTAAPLTAMLSQLNRRVLMAGLLATCFTGNLITGLASDYGFVLAGRLLISLANGVFWSTAVVTAVYMVSAKNAVNATSVVFAGISLATVLGIPAGTFLGGMYGWRTVFVALCLLSLFSFTLIICTLPAIQIPRAAKRGALSRVFKSPALVSLLVITALVGTGNYLAYTYITPFLIQVAGQGPTQISLLLLVYGIAGMIANFTIAPFAARAPYMSLGGVTALLSLSLLCLNMSAAHHSTVVITMAIWGAAYGAVPVLLQTLIFKTASQYQGSADAATSASVSVFNAAIGIGALLGGAMINILGASPIPYVAAAFAFAGVGVVLYSRHR